MIIRKKFRVEMGHIVRNCSSDRCAHSMHGHSAIIEVLLKGDSLDNAGMLYDFGLMKSTVKEFIDMFDHCYVFWDKDDPEYIESIKKFCDRWISLPFNPTAECLSVMFMKAVNQILLHTTRLNNECPTLHCCGVIYHETESGYAQCDVNDSFLLNDSLNKISFSPVLHNSMSDDLVKVFTGEIIEPKYKPFNQVKANAWG